MNNIQKNIICAIIKAQAASDAAKYNFASWEAIMGYKAQEWRGSQSFYALKNDCITSAIKILDSTGNCGIRYYYKEGVDQNGYYSLIIYFIIKIEGRTYQISFHDFNNKRIVRAKKHNGSVGAETAWNGRLGSSRAAAIKLARLIRG